MKYVLITRPKFDDTTAYLFSWSSKIIDFLQNTSFNLIDLKENKANRKSVESILLKKSPDLVIFNGHGTSSTIHGQDNEILIDSKNRHLLKSKIIYSISCSSAKTLGVKVAEEGGSTTFVGYENEFLFPVDTNKSCTPEKDNIAKPFMESSNQFSISLLKGKTTGEAYEDIKRKYNNWIIHYSAKESLPEASSIISCLVWNRENLVLLGFENKKA